MGGLKTIVDLNLLKGAAEFGKELRGMNDKIVFHSPLLYNKTKGTCVQQDQQ